MSEAKSAVIQLLQTVWSNANRAVPHSWERLNHAMYQSLRLAIGSGFTFTSDDFRGLDRFRCERWISDSDEWCYSMAVCEGNLSAAKAFEEWKGRSPLISDDVRPAETLGSFAHSWGDRQTERLHVGCSFPWKGEKVKLTSFKEDGSAVACSYHPPKRDERGCEIGVRKIKKRYTIDREAIVAERAERKERKSLEKILFAEVEAGKASAESVLKKLGVKTRAEYDTMPLAKIRRVADELAA